MRTGLAKSLFVALLAGSALAPARGQQAPQTPTTAGQAPPRADTAGGPADESLGDEEAGGEEIVVTGARAPQPGAVPGNIQPELQLDRREIRAYGASSLNDLLDALSPQTQSGRGRGGERPVILLNGRRISSFGEIRDIPPEALQRVDILPEEAALQLGYRADQRVVNFVLRRRFRAVTTELQAGLATEGGRPSFGAEANILSINRDGRWSLGGEVRHSGALLESERGLGDPFRSLLPATDQASLNATWNRALSDKVSATLNGTLDHTTNDSRLGLGSADSLGLAGPLNRDSDSLTGHLGLTLGGDLSSWRWSLTSNFDRARTLVRTDSRLDAAAARDRTETRTELADAALLMNGPLVRLPAGDARVSLTVGGERRGLAGDSRRAGLDQGRDLSRGLVFGQASLDVPIAGRRFLGGLGNLSANVNVRADHLSDFGTLTTLGGGLNWSPIEAVNLRASVTVEEGAPTMEQLGDPALATSGVRVFDFVRGLTTDITRIDGGNPLLRADRRHVFSLGARIRPIQDEDLVLTANFTRTRIDNPIASFPAATAEIEAAFPERFVRDAGGRLVSIDARPVNFARSEREELRWGVNYSRPIGPQAPPGGWRQRFRGAGQGNAGEPGASAPPAGEAGAQPPSAGQAPARDAGRGGGRGFGGFGGRGGFGGGFGGRLVLSAYHTVKFQDQLIIRQGLPPLDFLNGSAAGDRGGTPRHQLDLQAAVTRNGLGARLTATWQGGTTVRDVAGGDLRFADVATVNLRLFADLGLQRRLTRQMPVFRGARVSLSVNNLFNSRPEVTDAFGVTPLAYRGAYLDPLGRSVTISFRKQFFGGAGRGPFERGTRGPFTPRG